MNQNVVKKSLQSSNFQNSSNKPQWRIATPPQIQSYHPNYTQQPEKHNLQIIKEMKKWIFAVEAASNNDGIFLLSLVKLQNSLSDWCGTLEKMFTSLLLSEKKTFDQRLSSHITDAEIKMHQQQLDIKDRQIATLTKKLEERQQQLQMAQRNSLEALRKIKQIEELMGLLKIKQIQDCPVCGQLNQIVKVVSKSQKCINSTNEDTIDQKTVVHSMLKGIQFHLEQLKEEREMQLVNARGRGPIYW